MNVDAPGKLWICDTHGCHKLGSGLYNPFDVEHSHYKLAVLNILQNIFEVKNTPLY